MTEQVTVTLPSGTRVTCSKELAGRLGAKQDKPAAPRRPVKKKTEK